MSSSFDIMWAKFWAMPLSECNCLSLLSPDVLTSQMMGIWAQAMNLIVPSIKFRHVTISQAVSASLPAGLAWLWSVWKSSGRNLLFWKDTALVPGTTPRSSRSFGAARAGADSRPLPALLHLCSWSRLNQLHKYFPFHIAHIFSHWILFYLWILNLMFKNNWIHFYSSWKEHRRLVHFEYYFKYLSITRNGNPIFGSNNQS